MGLVHAQPRVAVRSGRVTTKPQRRVALAMVGLHVLAIQVLVLVLVLALVLVLVLALATVAYRKQNAAAAFAFASAVPRSTADPGFPEHSARCPAASHGSPYPQRAHRPCLAHPASSSSSSTGTSPRRRRGRSCAH